MLGSRKKKTAPEPREYAEGIYERFDDDLAVYTTPYGTQYVLPVDLLFTQKELLEYLDEVRAEHSRKENGEQNGTPAKENGEQGSTPAG